MKKIITVILLLFCYISLSASKGCREDYVLFEEYATKTPTPTETSTNSPEDDEDDEDDEEDIVYTPTITPTSSNIDDEDSDDEDDLDEDAVDVENVKANINMNSLLQDLEELSQETEDLNWLGNSFSDDENSNKDSKLGDKDKDSDEENDDELEFTDSDYDGYSDILELEMDTDPNSPSSFPYILKTRLFDRVSPDAINEALNSDNPIDSDNDGLSDDVESVIGSNPYGIDTDNDGVSDYREYINSTDPVISDL